MSQPRLFQESSFHVGEIYTLDSSGFHHLIHVLRYSTGKPLTLFNGKGGEYQGILKKVTKNAAYVHIEHCFSTEKESPLTLHLLQSMVRGEKMDFILQKSVELGVTHITPLYTEHSAIQLKGERLSKRQKHWQQVIISACEQCGRNRLPTLHTPLTAKEAFCENKALGKYLLHPTGQKTFPHTIPSQVAIAIGPEGGFSDEEEKEAIQQGWQSMTLGPRILRTETAGLAALAVLQCLGGDFS